MAYDTKRLYSALLNTGLQNKDNALYQVLLQLIGALQDTQTTVSSGSSGGGGGSTTEITNIYQILGDGDGGGGDDGGGIPGPAGIQGLTGATGPQAINIAFIAEDPEDVFQYPPIVGAQGNPGTTGADGALGTSVISDGDSYEETYVQIINTGSSGAAGSYVFLGVQTAAASASLNFTSLISSVYNEYVFEFEDILPATDNVDLIMRTSTDNGSSYAASAGDYRYADFVNNTGSFSTDDVCSASATHIVIAPTMDSGASTGGFRGTLKLYNPLNATQNKAVSFHGSAFLNDNQYYNIQGSGWRISTADIDAVQFLTTSGNLASGSIRMFGIKNS